MTHGEFEVVGQREYRGHPTGSVFEMRLDRNGHAAQRAIRRGDIRFIREVSPELQLGSYRLPPGWLPSRIPTTEARASGSLH